MKLKNSHRLVSTLSLTESVRSNMHLDLKDHVTRFTFFALNLQDEIRSSPHEIDAHECRAMCLELLRAFDRSENLPETFQLAKYALTAWIDDLLCRAKWPYASAWRNFPLEQELFGTTCRHWRFFEQAEVARRNQDWDALLVYQLCVEFGFRGIYAKDRVRVRLNDRLPMSQARQAQNPAPVLAGVAGEDHSAGSLFYADFSESAEGPRSSSFSASARFEPVLPPTLAEWSGRTFRGLRNTSPDGLPARPLIGRLLPIKEFFTDWAIVMAVGLLLFAVLFAIGH